MNLYSVLWSASGFYFIKIHILKILVHLQYLYIIIKIILVTNIIIKTSFRRNTTAS